MISRVFVCSLICLGLLGCSKKASTPVPTYPRVEPVPGPAVSTPATEAFVLPAPGNNYPVVSAPEEERPKPDPTPRDSDFQQPPGLARQPAAGATLGPSPAAESMAVGAMPLLTDDEIVKVTEAVDSGEIEQAKVMQEKAKDPRVKQFAEHMLAQHKRSKQQTANLAKQEQLEPMPSSAADEVRDKAQAQLSAIKRAPRSQVDRVYIDGQVDQHNRVLTLLDGHLIPSAKDVTLRAQLLETRSMVQRHLDEAKEIQAQTPPNNPY